MRKIGDVREGGSPSSQPAAFTKCEAVEKQREVVEKVELQGGRGEGWKSAGAVLPGTLSEEKLRERSRENGKFNERESGAYSENRRTSSLPFFDSADEPGRERSVRDLF